MYQSKLVSFIMRSWVLATVMGSCTFILLQFKQTPYLLTETDSSSFVSDPGISQRFYQDLNSDKSIEDYFLNNSSENASFILVRWASGASMEQWNFKGIFKPGLFVPLISDINQNGKSEIATVTVDHNSLYLNIIEPFGPSPILVKNRLLDTIWTRYATPYTFLFAAQPTDLNHDSSDEIVFSFSSGYARQPRNVYAYDIKSDSLWSSPFAGAFMTGVHPVDLDDDGKVELTGRCDASNNYNKDSVFLHDSVSWFIVLDEELKFKVPPVNLGPPLSYAMHLQIPVRDSLMSFLMVTGNRDSIPVFDWYRILPDYTLEKEKFPFISEFSSPYQYKKAAYSDGCLFFNRTDKPIFINQAGKVIIKRFFPNRVVTVDVLNQAAGMMEFEYCVLIDGKTLKLAFYSREGRKLAAMDNIDYADMNSISWANPLNGKPRLFLSGNKLMQWFEVSRNPWYYLQYLILLALIGGYYGFISLIRYSQTHEILRKENLRKELLELQLKTVKNQLDPHFTFNALSGLSYLAMSGDIGRVNDFINHFSSLLRSHLYTSDQALVKLSSEIEFLKHYMELQSMRYDDLIKLELEIDPEVDTSLLVPKMILQTHVENAVKHGLRPKLLGPREDIGLVKVFVFSKRESTIIVIEDNGVGRGYVHSPDQDSTGMGLIVLDQIYSAVKQLYKMKVTQAFEDLHDEKGKPSGTRVKIVIS